MPFHVCENKSLGVTERERVREKECIQNMPFDVKENMPVGEREYAGYAVRCEREHAVG